MLDHPDKVHEEAGVTSKEHPVEGRLDGHVMAHLSDYVRHAADHTRELADRLQGQKADELVASALTWTRKQPLLLVGGGIVLGFVLSQLVKSVRPGSAPSSEAGEN
jgi:hypothetical protein